jgi:cytochrome P450
VLTLLRHPEQWERLRREPELLPGAVEEVLRYQSPVQRATFRVATEPLEIAGVRIEAGERVSAGIGAANRDPAAFPDPDRFDVAREPNRHLAFGVGIHYCLGAALARLEARVAWTALLATCPDLRLADEEPVWAANSSFRGLLELRVAS